MSENPGSNDKSLETLDFIISVLKEHEINLDKTIDELSNVIEQIRSTKVGLKDKVEKSEEKITKLQQELANLIGCLSKRPKSALFAVEKQQEAQIQTAPATYSAVIQGKPNLILRCSKWSDFQDLAMHPQKLTFSYEEAEKVFQTNAIKENQMIIYAGSIPNLSVIFKKWLSGLLNIDEQDILEGSWISPK
jgi:hypothetical protein